MGSLFSPKMLPLAEPEAPPSVVDYLRQFSEAVKAQRRLRERFNTLKKENTMSTYTTSDPHAFKWRETGAASLFELRLEAEKCAALGLPLLIEANPHAVQDFLKFVAKLEQQVDKLVKMQEEYADE